MALVIEEELDLALLGFDVPVASAGLENGPSKLLIHSSLVSESSSPRSDPELVGRTTSGRYTSADWIPAKVNGAIVDPPPPQLNVDEPRVCSPKGTPRHLAADSTPEIENGSSQKASYRRRLVKIPGSRHRRKAIRIISFADPINNDDMDASSQPEKEEIQPGPGKKLADIFGIEVYDKIESMAKLNATTGNSLPTSIRDLFPALSDLSTAIPLVNSVRQSLDLPHIRITKSNKVDLLRLVAQLRSNLYITLMASLSVPSAPIVEVDEQLKGEDDESITLTPDNLQKLGSVLPKAFPAQRTLIRAALVDEARLAYGERDGRVVWQGGIGRLLRAEGGFRGKNLQDGNVHVFLDHSNILFGLLHCLYSNPSDSLPPKHLRVLSLPALSLLLRRGRPTPPGTLHAVASSPLKQDLDPLVRLGWEVSVLKRVEIQEDEVEDPDALKLTPKPMPRLPIGGEVHGLRRYKEQAVDEILQLKLLQALNSSSTGGTIVLATGDAKGGQFNRDGFVGAVREALKRDWSVELWSFRAGLSRTWIDVAKRERWFGGPHSRFSIHHFDTWADLLVDVL